MRVLVTGANGQVGRALLHCAPPGVEVDAVGRADIDLESDDVTERVVARHPDVIMHAAAYTAVDRAESEPEAAYRVNADAVGAMVRAARACGARFVLLSTDFVFDGSAGRPYTPQARPSPLGVYGASKLRGEQQARAEGGEQVTIVRTAWVYSAHGSNFVRTMLRLMRERDRIGVVADQIGTPTSVGTLAPALWEIALSPAIRGVLHWTDLGVASWYDFAVAIQEEALERGWLERAAVIEPIRTEDYPTPARRPSYSVLDKTETLSVLKAPRMHWRCALRALFDTPDFRGVMHGS